MDQAFGGTKCCTRGIRQGCGLCSRNHGYARTTRTQESLHLDSRRIQSATRRGWSRNSQGIVPFSRGRTQEPTWIGTVAHCPRSSVDSSCDCESSLAESIWSRACTNLGGLWEPRSTSTLSRGPRLVGLALDRQRLGHETIGQNNCHEPDLSTAKHFYGTVDDR